METKVVDLFEELDRGPAAAEAIVSSSPKAETVAPRAVASPLAQVVTPGKKLSPEQQREMTLKNIESELYLSAMLITADSFRFREIEPDQEEPPQEWVDELEYSSPGRGYELAKQRLRAAVAGHKSKKDAPVAIQMAQATVVGIGRARAQLSAGPKTLNVQVVQMTAPLPEFPELILTQGEK